MKGSVAGRKPYIQVTFVLPGLPDLGVEFLIDTGFDGFLTMPLPAVTALNLPFIRPLTAVLADGTVFTADVYEAVIQWNGSKRSVEVIALGQFPLLGTGLLYSNRLGIDFVNGGDVVILARP